MIPLASAGWSGPYGPGPTVAGWASAWRQNAGPKASAPVPIKLARRKSRRRIIRRVRNHIDSRRAARFTPE
jgi:hypothetical protein